MYRKSKSIANNYRFIKVQKIIYKTMQSSNDSNIDDNNDLIFLSSFQSNNQTENNEHFEHNYVLSQQIGKCLCT